MNLLRFFPPICFLEADGELASDLIPFIKSFEFSDEHKKPDQVKIVFINDGFRFTDDTRLAEGVTFRVRWGYPTLLSETLIVRVQKVAPAFPKSDFPTITLISWDARIDMSYQSSSKNYGAVSSAQVARVLAKKWNLKEDIEESNDGSKVEMAQPSNMSDLAYIVKLADKIHFRFDIVGETLVFKKHGFDDAPELEYTYFVDREGVVLAFEPEIKEKKLKGKLKVTTTDPKTGKTETAESKPQNAKESRRGVKDGGKIAEKVIRGVTPSTPEANKVAAIQAGGSKDKIDLDADKAKLEVVGDPRLRKGKVVQVNGVGRYSGNWYVAKTKHAFGSNQFYKTEATVQRAPLNDKKTTDNNKNKNADGTNGNPVKAVTTYQGVTDGGKLAAKKVKAAASPPKG